MTESTPPKFYVYAVVETGVTPVELKEVKFTRAAAREWAETPKNNTATLRIRRAKLTLFES